MATSFGVHTGPSNVGVPEMLDLWRRIEQMPYDWISIWDHLYGVDGGSTHCLEAVSMHTALAMTTSRVRCGSLVYCAGYRHPAILANAIATIDHISGGRAEIGLGAGWAGFEYEAFGIPFGRAGQRLDLLEESAACIRALLHDGACTFEGRHFTMRSAELNPQPVQSQLPIWIGGAGELRTLRIVARYGDGWNVPFLSPAEFARKRHVLAEHCVAEGRDPSEIRCSINVGCARDHASLEAQFGPLAEFVRPGVLMGGPEAVVEGIAAYVDAGADQINLALRAPFDLAVVEHLAEAITRL